MERPELQAEFLTKLTARLEAGAEEYGDGSFYRPNNAEEILEEIMDVAGWAFVIWVQMRMRLQGLELAARTLDEGKHKLCRDCEEPAVSGSCFCEPHRQEALTRTLKKMRGSQDA